MIPVRTAKDRPYHQATPQSVAGGELMIRHLVVVLSLVGSVLVGGCVVHTGGGGTAPSAAELQAVPPGANPALIVRNASANTICYVNFSSTRQSTWGPDRLGPSETVPPGRIRGWRVPADAYDVRVQDCQRNVLADDRSVAVAGQGIVVTYY